MSSPKSWPSQLKYGDCQFSTVQPQGSQRFGLDVIQRGVFQAATDTVEAGSTDRIIVASAHAARVGDLIRFTSGANNSVEMAVVAVATNSITLGGSVTAPSPGDTFNIMRYVTPTLDSSGGIVTTSGPLEIQVDGVATVVNYDTGTPSNSVAVPVRVVDSVSPALDYGVATAAQRTAAQIGNATGAADFGTGNSSAQTLRTVLASDQPAIPVTPSAVITSSGTIAAITQTVEITLSEGQSTVAFQVTGVYTGALTPQVTVNGTDWVQLVSILNVTTNTITSTVLSGVTGVFQAEVSGYLGFRLRANAAITGTATINMRTSASSALVALDTPLPPGTAQIGIVGQAGTWNITNITGTVSLPTGAATEATLSAVNGKLNSLGQKTMANSVPVTLASDQSTLPVAQEGLAAVNLATIDFTGTPVTSAAYVTLLASTSAAIKKVQIFMGQGSPLILALGAASSEVDQIYIFPGGNGLMELEIPTSTRVSLKAVNTSATEGYILVNFLG